MKPFVLFGLVLFLAGCSNDERVLYIYEFTEGPQDGDVYSVINELTDEELIEETVSKFHAFEAEEIQPPSEPSDYLLQVHHTDEGTLVVNASIWLEDSENGIIWRPQNNTARLTEDEIEKIIELIEY